MADSFASMVERFVRGFDALNLAARTNFSDLPPVADARQLVRHVVRAGGPDRDASDDLVGPWTQHRTEPGWLPAGWREDRRLYRLILPPSGWFVDIEAAESIAAITKSWPNMLAAGGVGELTTAHLHAEHRDLTTAIATKIHSATPLGRIAAPRYLLQLQARPRLEVLGHLAARDG